MITSWHWALQTLFVIGLITFGPFLLFFGTTIACALMELPFCLLGGFPEEPKEPEPLTKEQANRIAESLGLIEGGL